MQTFEIQASMTRPMEIQDVKGDFTPAEPASIITRQKEWRWLRTELRKVCPIYYEFEIQPGKRKFLLIGTGFLCSFEVQPGVSIEGLVTAYHVLPDISIQLAKVFVEIQGNESPDSLCLAQNIAAFWRNQILDVVFIAFKKTNETKNINNYFRLAYGHNVTANDIQGAGTDIAILHYGGGRGDLQFSEGTFYRQLGIHKHIHTASIDPGSSGAPTIIASGARKGEVVSVAVSSITNGPEQIMEALRDIQRNLGRANIEKIYCSSSMHIVKWAITKTILSLFNANANLINQLKDPNCAPIFLIDPISNIPDAQRYQPTKTKWILYADNIKVNQKPEKQNEIKFYNIMQGQYTNSCKDKLEEFTVYQQKEGELTWIIHNDGLTFETKSSPWFSDGESWHRCIWNLNISPDETIQLPAIHLPNRAEQH